MRKKASKGLFYGLFYIFNEIKNNSLKTQKKRKMHDFPLLFFILIF